MKLPAQNLLNEWGEKSQDEILDIILDALTVNDKMEWALDNEVDLNLIALPGESPEKLELIKRLLDAHWFEIETFLEITPAEIPDYDEREL